MARHAKGLEPLISHEGATRKLFRNCPGPMYEAVAVIWNSKQVKAIREELDRFETTGGRRFDYPRSLFLGFKIVGLVLDMNRREAHAWVQGSEALRKLFGLTELSPGMKRKLQQLNGTQDVAEPGFPTRQMHSEFVNWLKRYLERHGKDLTFMVEQAYESAFLDVLERHPWINTTRIVIDGKRILSPIRYDRSDDEDDEKRDPGARVWARNDERPEHMRQKYSAVLADIPLVIYSDVVTPESEAVHVKETMMPTLAARDQRLHERAKAEGITAYKGLAGALIIGDGAFSNTPVYEATYKHGFQPCYRLPDAFDRRLIGQTTVTKHGVVAKLDLCSDGTFYCPCDRDRELNRRIPMHQLRGAPGITGHVRVRCSQGCSNSGLTFYVSFRGPDLDLEGQPLKPERDLDLVTPVSRADKRVHALIFKGCNAIEHYNGMLLTLFGLGIKDRNGRRRIHGNFAHQLWYTLADLCWNLMIGINLDQMKTRGESPKILEWNDVWENTLADHFSVRARKGLDLATKFKLGVYTDP